MADPNLSNPGAPSQLDREQASWRHLQAQIRLSERQAFWEIPKALAMILIASAAIAAAGGLAGWMWPAHPQQIIVRFEQPLAVKLQP